MTFSRRDLLIGGAAGLAAASPFLSATAGFAQAPATKYRPEQGATLRLLRWSPFVKGDEDQWIANSKKFTDATGVEVRIDKESWEDIRPKAATAPPRAPAPT
jgi:multiple sugar transport system substrate-binding protein